MLRILLPILLLAPPAAASPVRRVRWVMGTALEITAYGPEAAVEAAFQEVERLDRILSLYKADSELSSLNQAAAEAPFACSDSMWEAVSLSDRLAAASRGAFDPTVLPLIRGGAGELPRVGYAFLALNHRNRTVRFLKKGMGLDFGGLGKGLALDKAAAVLRRAGARAALLNFGGQVYALGAEPGREGWLVRAWGGPNLLLRDASASTSGNS